MSATTTEAQRGPDVAPTGDRVRRVDLAILGVRLAKLGFDCVLRRYRNECADAMASAERALTEARDEIGARS